MAKPRCVSGSTGSAILQNQQVQSTGGNCFEIYGFDIEENKVEIYFNSVDVSIVKKEMH